MKFNTQENEPFLEDGGVIVDYYGTPVYISEDDYSPRQFFDKLFNDVCGCTSLDKLANFLEIDPEDLYEGLWDSPTPEDIGELVGNKYEVTTIADIPSEEDYINA